MNKKKRIIFILLSILCIFIIGAGIIIYSVFKPFDVSENTYIYIDNDDDIDSVCTKVSQTVSGTNTAIFSIMASASQYSGDIHTGRYLVSSDMNILDLFLNLRGHASAPLMLVVPSVRTLPELAGRLSRQIMLDSLTILETFTDDSICESLGYTRQTIPSLFIPDSYEVYWDISASNLMKRFEDANEQFWTSARLSKAETLGMTPNQVCTLASIIDSETSADSEKPTIAGLYINRLNKGMFLQSDPTVIFAVGDFRIHRVLKQHLAYDSPYNTYKYAGLPPGPIRIASIAAIDAVLNHDVNDYLYMCAKEDLSGTHNFASTGAQHLINARKYQQALNQRGIRR